MNITNHESIAIFVEENFVDSYRFMATSLSNLTDKLSQINKN